MRHTLQFKLDVIRHYLSGNDSQEGTASKFHTSHSQLQRWLAAYRFHGEAGLMPDRTRCYSPEFKLRVVHHALKSAETSASIAARFDIPAFSTVESWLKLYLEKGSDAFHQENRGRRKKMPKTFPQKPPEEMTPEEMQAELRYLRAELAYQKKLQALIQEKERKAQRKKPGSSMN